MACAVQRGAELAKGETGEALGWPDRIALSRSVLTSQGGAFMLWVLTQRTRLA